MIDVPVVAFVVGCSANLLSCQQIPTGTMLWADMPRCEQALPAIERRREAQDYAVVMSKCHYVIPAESGGSGGGSREARAFAGF